MKTTTPSIHFFKTANAARKACGAPESPDASGVESLYPTLVNSYYAALTDWTDPEHDPIYRQWHPDLAELSDSDSSYDPLAEEAQMPSPYLIRRYRDRAVLLVTAKCAMRCRFCFRKRTWTKGRELPDITDDALTHAVDFLRKTPEIKEVLVSGGDPLMLSATRLRQIFSALEQVPHLEIIRLGSRLPAVLPAAVTEEKIAILSQAKCLWLATHFNHPRELTPEAEALCLRLVKSGIPIVNQTVLLAGVNDNAEVLEELFRHLVRIRVKPHYLFHVDPVRGVRHFATGIEKGLEILRAFRPRLSSLAVPTFAIDLPEGGGKVALQPTYEKEGRFPDILEEKWIEYPQKLPKVQKKP